MYKWSIPLHSTQGCILPPYSCVPWVLSAFKSLPCDRFFFKLFCWFHLQALTCLTSCLTFLYNFDFAPAKSAFFFFCSSFAPSIYQHRTSVFCLEFSLPRSLHSGSLCVLKISNNCHLFREAFSVQQTWKHSKSLSAGFKI